MIWECDKAGRISKKAKDNEVLEQMNAVTTSGSRSSALIGGVYTSYKLSQGKIGWKVRLRSDVG